MDDLDHLLGRLDRPQHVLARGQVTRLGDEVLDRRQGHVGVEQGQAHLAQGLVDVGGRQHASTGHPVEDGRQPVA